MRTPVLIGGASGLPVNADTLSSITCNAGSAYAFDQASRIRIKEGRVPTMTEPTGPNKSGNAGDGDRVSIRMGLRSRDAVEERSTYIVPLTPLRFKDDEGLARYEVNVVINGVLLAQVMITATERGPATVEVFDAADLDTAPICPTCDAGDPTNPLACECNDEIVAAGRLIRSPLIWPRKEG